MIRRLLWVSLLLVLDLGLRGAPATRPQSVLLISLDGFRWDYCDLHPTATPNLRALRRTGAYAKELIPVFPSLTFPNHYSIVTGLYPAHHGIVGNKAFDPESGSFFYYSRTESARDSRWWGGEPIWITAVRQGRVSACSFWPGSEAEIKGLHATIWKPFDYSPPFATRLDEIISWLARTGPEQPAIVTFYLKEVDDAGHKHGPDSPGLVAALQEVDAEVGEIVARLEREGLRDSVNLIVVSDHGMTTVSTGRVIFFDDYFNLDDIQIDFDGPVAGIRPLHGQTPEQLVKAFAKAQPNAVAYVTSKLPGRLHYRDNPRIPPVVIIAAEGWMIGRRKSLEDWFKRGFIVGEHGFDPELRSMHGIFIANGPAIRSGVVMKPVENIHIYNLMCRILGLQPAPNDGDNRLVKALLRP